MRAALMFTEIAISAYPKDMTRCANVELGDSGACRRR